MTLREDFGEMLDTSPENRARYYALLRALTPQQRAAKCASLSRTVRALARDAIRRAFPDANAREIDVRLAVRLYGRDFATRIYGHVPGDAR